jgi:hypothetical protein
MQTGTMNVTQRASTRLLSLSGTQHVPVAEDWLVTAAQETRPTRPGGVQLVLETIADGMWSAIGVPRKVKVVATLPIGRSNYR